MDAPYADPWGPFKSDVTVQQQDKNRQYVVGRFFKIIFRYFLSNA